MIVKDVMVAIEELLATQVIKRGKILNGTDSSATRIIIEKLCINCCGGRWEFGTYFFIDEQINVYLNFDDIHTGEKVIKKYTFSKNQVEDFVFKYIGNKGSEIENLIDKKVESKACEKVVKKTKKKESNKAEQMSLF